MNEFFKIMGCLGQAKSLAITGHLSPDADSVGSALALARALRAAGKEVAVVYDSPLPDNLSFLLGEEKILTTAEFTGQPDLLVLVDVCEIERCDAGSLFRQPYPLIVIDHHLATPPARAQAALVMPEMAACAQIVFEVLVQMNLPLDVTTATCLYAAIAADTGGFVFTSTTSQTMMAVAELLSYPIDTETVRFNLFERRSFAALKMIAVAIEHLQQQGSIAWTYLDEQAKKLHSAGVNDCENIVNYTLKLPGVQCGILFEEMAEEGKVRVSLRSRGNYNVAAFAAKFDGGGHHNAAGLRREGSLEQVMSEIITAIMEYTTKG